MPTTRLPGDELPKYEELLERLEALENRAIVLTDLPLASLQTKLENDWQPNPGVLLPPASITGSSLAPQTATFEREIEAIQTVVPLPYATNWSDFDATTYEGGGYYKRDSRVYLQGLVKKSVALAASDVIATLPAPYRPTRRRPFIVISNGAIGRVDVRTDGTITVETGNNTYVSLEGISYRV